MYTAADLLSRYWDGSIPVDPARIAQTIGIIVRPELSLTGGASGLIEQTPTEIVIRFDATEPPVRQRFTIAHELGHFALGHLQSGQTCFRDTKAQFYSVQRDPRETMANQFAAELLMPEQIVKHLVLERHLMDVTRLANVFGVSEPAMGFRLKNLALA